MRKPLIAGNWKMNLKKDEAVALINALKQLITDDKADVVICPPFHALMLAARELDGCKYISLGAQNVHWADKGAFTGEISAPMLLDCGCKYAIIGHSERRQYFGETDETVNKRVAAALSHGLTPIVCVGESLAQREAGETDALLTDQVKAAFAGISLADFTHSVIAYEPIWAIGTGKTATAAEADRTIGVIRSYIGEIYGLDAASQVRILYGGSMNAKNASELMECVNIDGGLIGGASLVASDFATIVHA